MATRCQGAICLSHRRLLQQNLPGGDLSRCSNVKPKLLDHLVGAGEKSCGNIEAERVGWPEIDRPLELGPLLNRQVGWFCSLQDFVNVSGGAVPHIFETDRVRE